MSNSKESAGEKAAKIAGAAAVSGAVVGVAAYGLYKLFSKDQ